MLVLVELSPVLLCVCLISSTNVRKWESELQTMKNNNTRLQAALEESKQHLSQWKTQLQKYKEENDALKKKVRDLDLGLMTFPQSTDCVKFYFYFPSRCIGSAFGRAEKDGSR